MSVAGPVFEAAASPRRARALDRKDTLRFLGGAVTVLLVFAWYIDLHQPFRGDEIHFAETIREFGESPSFDLLIHYEEMSGPLPFLLYGVWGRVFGYDPLTLRTLSIVIAAATYALWIQLSSREIESMRRALLATACVLLQPYMLFVSLFVYTDMLTMLFLLTALIGLRQERPVVLGAGIAGALVCRQHLAFLPMAVGVFLLLRVVHRPCRRDFHLLAGCCLGTVPLLCLLMLWNGPCPDNVLKRTYLTEGTRFHVDSAWLYLGMTAVYLAPALIWRRRTVFASAGLLAVAVLISLFYWRTPITPSPSSVAAGILHVGLFHRAMATLLPGSAPFQFVLWLALIPGLVTFLFLGRDLIRRCSRQAIEFPVFLDLTAIAFVAVMPWAYLHWEKYLLPLVPILVARLTWDIDEEFDVSPLPGSARRGQVGHGLPV